MQVLHLLGQSDYAEVHALQGALVDARPDGAIGDVLILTEHRPTITLGRARGAERSVVLAGEVPVVSVERGGDATWHGPGQLVAYPILQLVGERRDLRDHLRRLEQGVITLLRELGLPAQRDPRNTGVWLPGPGAAGPRKVCSIGVAVRRWVSWHGLALNIDPDPAGFARIRPCGFDAEVMTRLCDHLHPSPSLAALAEPLANHLGAALASGPASWVRVAAKDASPSVVMDRLRSER